MKAQTAVPSRFLAAHDRFTGGLGCLPWVVIVGIALAGGLYFMEAREEFSRLKTIQAESRRRIAEAEVRLKYQEQVLERLRTDPAYVEKVIRRKLGYARPEEYVFRFEN